MTQRRAHQNKTCTRPTVGCRTLRISKAPDLVGFRPAADGFGAPGAILDERILLSGLRAAFGFGMDGLPAGL